MAYLVDKIGRDIDTLVPGICPGGMVYSGILIVQARLFWFLHPIGSRMYQ